MSATVPILTASERIGTELGGRYRLERILARGGMGVVYDARHTWTGRRVAVKVITPRGHETSTTPSALNEARLATQLMHPSVVQVLDMGTDDHGVAYLVMEYLEGQPLSEIMAQQGGLDPAVALAYLLPIIGAVATAHDASILHRDLKPNNVFICSGPGGKTSSKLLDFGIAKVTRNEQTESGVIIGTPAYMAPEHVMQGDVGVTADIWALGVVLYEALSHQRPFEAPTSTALLLKIVNERAPFLRAVAPGVPTALAAVIDRSLEPKPSRRFSDARELARALAFAAAQDGIEVPENPDPVGLPDWACWLAEMGEPTVRSMPPRPNAETTALGADVGTGAVPIASDSPLSPSDLPAAIARTAVRRLGLALGAALAGVGIYTAVSQRPASIETKTAVSAPAAAKTSSVEATPPSTAEPGALAAPAVSRNTAGRHGDGPPTSRDSLSPERQAAALPSAQTFDTRGAHARPGSKSGRRRQLARPAAGGSSATGRARTLGDATSPRPSGTARLPSSADPSASADQDEASQSDMPPLIATW